MISSHPHPSLKLPWQLRIHSNSCFYFLIQPHHWSKQNLLSSSLLTPTLSLVLWQKLSLGPQDTFFLYHDTLLAAFTNTASIVPLSGIKPNCISHADTILHNIFQSPFSPPSFHAHEASWFHSNFCSSHHHFPWRLEPLYEELIQLAFHIHPTYLNHHLNYVLFIYKYLRKMRYVWSYQQEHMTSSHGKYNGVWLRQIKASFRVEWHTWRGPNQIFFASV